MTGTRSALIALCVIAPILILVVVRMRAQLAFTGWRRPRQALVALVLLLGLAILGSWPTDNPKIVQEGRGNTALERSFQRTASMAQGTEYTEGSFSVRSTMWMATARMMVANPWAGVGAGAWEVQIPLYQRTDTTLETDYYAHNETLQLLSEYGLLVGGLCLAFLWAYLIKAASTTWHLPRATSQEGPLRAVVLTSLLAQLIVSNAGFPWHLAGGGMLLALCLGLLSGSDLRLRAIAGGIYDSKAVLRYSYSALTLVSICLALALHWTWQAASAERHIVRAVQLAAKITRASNKGEAFSATDRDTMLEHIRSGIDITPHYRRFTALVAEPLTAIGDCVNAVWILNSVVRSRPHVVVLWAALAKCESQLGHHDRAQWALKEVQRLKPDAVATGTLAVRLLANRKDFERASQLAGTLFMAGNFDWELTEWAYALGYKTANWQLAIRALELRNARWPQQSADGHLRLGKIYAEPLKDADRAVAEFKAGMAAVPPEQRADYIRQVPDPFKAQM